MTVVYVDSVFILNALADYLLLLCTARLAGVPPRRGRLLLAAALGGAYAVGVFLPGCGFLAATPVKLAAGAGLALAAFGAERRLLRLTLLFFAVSCGFAGCVLALGLLAGTDTMTGGVFYTRIDGKVLLLSTAAAYAVLSGVFRGGARHTKAELIPVRLSLGGREAAFTALRDTGNTLCDPMTGRQTLVVWAGAVGGLWPPELRGALTPEALKRPVQALETLHGLGAGGFRLLPYRAVGVSDGLLLAVKCDWADIGGVRQGGQLVALSATEVSDGGGYAALWGGEERKGKEHAAGVGKAAGAAGPMGAAAAGQGDVHRGERYPAPAAEPGGGSGAAGAHRPGGDQADPHRA